MKKQISFSTIKLSQLEGYIDFQLEFDNAQFEKWFDYAYELSKEEEEFLFSLLEDERLLIHGFSEEELKAKFIVPLLNKVKFKTDKIADWYERSIRATVNDLDIGGKTDFLVASGKKEPKLPYFFIQEFKPSESTSSPHDQLLAELLVAIELNEESQVLGAYVVNELWRFMLLRKNTDNTYTYFLSSGYNCLNKEDLKKLYISLQGVKADILERFIE
ncbi:MAG: hypothetical protein AAGG68_24190 [Bacteroidota bacterium]